MPDNKKWLDIIKAQEQSKDLHETFHTHLDRAEDPFSLVADYFGRGVFKKLTVITADEKTSSTSFKPKAEETNPYNIYGPGAEAKIRLNEGKNTSLGKYFTKKKIKNKNNLIFHFLIFFLFNSSN